MCHIWDGVSGEPFDPELVRIARQEEMEERRKHGMRGRGPIGECAGMTGEPPTRW